MKKTYCDRCGGEQDMKNMPNCLTKDGPYENEGYNKLVTRKLIKRKVKFFGWESILKMLDYVEKWVEGEVEYDICESCQTSFNTWMDEPDYEKKILQRALENPEEAMKLLEESIVTNKD